MADHVGQQLGNYQLTRLLGEGGFAEVYLGEHIHLGTQAAIKLLHTQLASDDIDKFRTEARTIARLLHPNIVRVLDFGVEGRTPFLVMDFAPNGTLRQRHPKGTPIPLSTVISYVKQVAEALQCAHDEKLIHRDVKPENMLLGRRNEVLLSDFGIALVAQSSRYQGTQDMAGTISYMAPEQIQGKPRPASDQYALAVVVYEWLSGERPFHGSFTEIAVQHTIMPPPPLREKAPTVPPGVEQVVMAALEKDTQKRFKSVQAFATALEQMSQAYAPTIIRPLPPSIEPTIEAVPFKLGSSASPVKPTPPVAQTPRIVPPVNVPAKSPVAPPSPPTKRIVQAKPPGTTVFTYSGHSRAVYAVAWSPDGSRIASSGNDRSVQVWEAATGARVSTYSGHSSWVWSVTWSPDGSRIASASGDKTVQIWNANTGTKISTYQGHSNWIYAVAWSPSNSYIASAGEDRLVHIWDATTGTKVSTCRGHSDLVHALIWSPNGSRIASASYDKTVQVWDASRGDKVFICRGHSHLVNAVAWSPDGSRIASASYDKTARIWDASTGDSILTYNGHSDGVCAVAWSPDGLRIASASYDKTAQVWNASPSGNVLTYRGHSDWVLSVAWSPDGSHIASASRDNTVQVWVAP